MTTFMTGRITARSSTARSERAQHLRQPPKVREASVEDCDQIAALQVRNGLIAKSRENWMALWTENPAYSAHEGRWPIGWVLEAEGGKIVGSVANIPLAYRFRGRDILAATASSWAVDPEYRGYSMQVYYRFLKQKGAELFVCTSVSSSAEPIVRYCGFSKVPAGRWQECSLWITNYLGFSRSILKRASVPLASALSYPASAILFSRDMFRASRLRVQGPAPEVELCPEFDSRFDEFWRELSHLNNGRLLAVRNRETLAWHFRALQPGRDVWILAAGKGSRLLAYAVFDRQDNAALGLQRIRLVDFQALDEPEKMLRCLLSWMLRKCREEGIHVLEVVGCWHDHLLQTRIGATYHRRLPSWTYYYKGIDCELSAALQDPAVWAPSSFDGDTSL